MSRSFGAKPLLNLRVPQDLDRRLDQLAAEEHTSTSALLLQGQSWSCSVTVGAVRLERVCIS
ncbi:ribbon-helix-helix domain-containing protein [Arthrobacter sp. D1-29]